MVKDRVDLEEPEDVDELLDLVRDTVEQLNILGDRLEGYAMRKTVRTDEESPDGR